MTSQSGRDELIAALDAAVEETLSFFAGPAQVSSARIDRWGAWEVLAHFPYWHDATAWGIASAELGGPPWQLSGGADAINGACLKLRAGESFDEIISQVRQAQARLVRVARQAPDLDAPVFRFIDGRQLSVRERLEMIARHWRSHLQALREAGA